MRYDSGNIKDLISTSIDRLDNDNKLHIGIITITYAYLCLVQKTELITYASGLVFGYRADKILYQRKFEGSWNEIREI
jgi:hypothetical protein